MNTKERISKLVELLRQYFWSPSRWNPVGLLGSFIYNILNRKDKKEDKIVYLIPSDFLKLLQTDCLSILNIKPSRDAVGGVYYTFWFYANSKKHLTTVYGIADGPIFAAADEQVEILSHASVEKFNKLLDVADKQGKIFYPRQVISE